MKYICNLVPYGAVFSTGVFKKRYWKTDGEKVTEIKVEEL